MKSGYVLFRAKYIYGNVLCKDAMCYSQGMFHNFLDENEIEYVH